MTLLDACKWCKYGHLFYKLTDKYIGQALHNYGEYSDLEIQLLQKIINYLPSECTVADVGANVGAMTVPLSQTAAKTILAFEPQSQLFNLLLRNIQPAWMDDRFAMCYNWALSDRAGSIIIPVIDYDTLIPFEEGAALEIEVPQPDLPTERVTIETLDGVIYGPCHLIKIDVEGMEEKVLRGGEKLIRRCRPVLYIEDNRKEKSESLRAYIRELGYRIHTHYPPLYNPDNFLHNPNNIYGSLISQNLLCWPAESRTPKEILNSDKYLLPLLPPLA